METNKYAFLVKETLNIITAALSVKVKLEQNKNVIARHSKNGKGKKMSEITCYYCGTQGHHAQDCLSKGDNKHLHTIITEK